MEIGNKCKKKEEKCYNNVLTLTEMSDNNHIGGCEPNSHFTLKAKRTDSLGMEQMCGQQTSFPALSRMSCQLVTQRRSRKKDPSKENTSKSMLYSSGSVGRQRYDTGKIQRIFRITDLIRLFFQKVSRTNIFRKPIQYDPYENEFNYSKHQIIQKIQNIYIPKMLENAFITAEIIYILAYIFVFPLTLLFPQVEDSDISLCLKIFGLVFCLLGILERFRSVPHDQKQNVSQDNYKKNIYKLKVDIATQLVIFALTVVSLVLTQLQQQIGSYFFIGMAFNIKPYLNQIGKLQNHFFTATHRQKYWDLIKVLFMNLIVCHLLACALIGIANIRPQESWMIYNNINQAPWWQQYVWSYYFGTTIILTIGFGDLHPGNYIQAFFIIIISFCACLFFGYNINYIGNLINLIKQQEVEKNDKLKVFNSLANRTAVSKPTFQEITNYIVQSSKIRQQFNYAQERQLIQQLPDGLRSTFLAEANIKLFNHLQTLISFTNQSIQRLSLNIQAKICHPDQVIKRARQPFNLMILQSGEVGFVANRKHSRIHGLVIQRISNTIKQESKLVCADILQNEPISYDIKSLSYSTVYVMEKDVFQDCIRQSKIDYEVYRQALDSCKYKPNQFGVIKCRFCQKQHTLFECPRLHFCPFKKIHPFKYNLSRPAQKQKRVSFVRNKQEINYYDYASAAIFQQNMSYSGLSHSESYNSKNTSKSKHLDGRRASFNHVSNQNRHRESYLFTMEMVTQIRQDIQRLKVDTTDTRFEFTLWQATDCDQICDFKSYFSKYNSNKLGQKYSILAHSKNIRRKIHKKFDQ